MLNMIDLQIILFSTYDISYEENTDRKTLLCCIFDWHAYCRFKSINYTSICYKAVIYVNCVDHTESQSIRVTIFDFRKC